MQKHVNVGLTTDQVTYIVRALERDLITCDFDMYKDGLGGYILPLDTIFEMAKQYFAISDLLAIFSK